MTPADIMSECRACSNLTQPEIDWFIRQSVPALALIQPLAIATDTVNFTPALSSKPTGAGRFEFSRCRPADDAVSAVIIPAFDEWGYLADLTAWHPKTSAVASWLGRVGLLGQDMLFAPRFGDPIVVHETPLEWLRFKRTGVVIVDPRRAAPLLRAAEPLATSSVQQGERLRKMLAVRPARVLVTVAAKISEAA
jgi:hypothetical protein